MIVKESIIKEITFDDKNEMNDAIKRLEKYGYTVSNVDEFTIKATHFQNYKE